MPTLRPTQNSVPRWRTMIVPALMKEPSERFTPSRFDSESRPLRELPTPFLWAMVGLLSAVDGGDSQARLLLAVASAPAVALLRLVLEDDELFAPEVVVDPGRDAGAF